MKKIIGFAVIMITFMTACQNEDTNIVQLAKPDVTFSEFMDTRDNNVYKCITIGDQTWMAENLRFQIPGGVIGGCLTYDAATTIRVTTQQTQAKFNNQVLYDSIVNYLYTVNYMAGFYAEMFVFTGLIESDPRGKQSYSEIMSTIRNDLNLSSLYSPYVNKLDYFYSRENSIATLKAMYLEAERQTDHDYVTKYGYLYKYTVLNEVVPAGWRIPTDEDWKKLEKNLGMDPAELNLMEEWRGEGVGTLLKEGPDGIGFDAQLNGGNVYGIGEATSTYIRKGINAFFWTSTLSLANDTTAMAVIRTLQVNENKILRGYSNIISRGSDSYPAYNVRCIKIKEEEEERLTE